MDMYEARQNKEKVSRRINGGGNRALQSKKTYHTMISFNDKNAKKVTSTIQLFFHPNYNQRRHSFGLFKEDIKNGIRQLYPLNTVAMNANDYNSRVDIVADMGARILVSLRDSKFDTVYGRQEDSWFKYNREQNKTHGEIFTNDERHHLTIGDNYLPTTIFYVLRDLQGLSQPIAQIVTFGKHSQQGGQGYYIYTTINQGEISLRQNLNT